MVIAVVFVFNQQVITKRWKELLILKGLVKDR